MIQNVLQEIGGIGLYGVISYIVMQRRNEIGIRMALGARTSSVAMMVAGQSGRLVAVGIVLGIGVSLAGARVLGALLFGVSPTDPLSLAVVAIVLTGVAALASFAPTLRAAGVDPSEALRAE